MLLIALTKAIENKINPCSKNVMKGYKLENIKVLNFFYMTLALKFIYFFQQNIFFFTNNRAIKNILGLDRYRYYNLKENIIWIRTLASTENIKD